MQKKFMEQVGGMLNRYSGKDELNHEIEKLQSRVLEMEIDLRRLEKCERKLKVAVNDKQIAEEKLKASRKKIETLEHELEKQKLGEDTPIALRTEIINLPRMQEIIQELESLDGKDKQYVTLTIPPDVDLNIPEYRNIEHLIDLETINIISTIKKDTGLILFYDRPGIIREIFLPPLQIRESKFLVGERFSTGEMGYPAQTKQLLVIAAHAGESLLLMASPDEEIRESKLVRSSVKAKHGKGGFSQRRFERLRDEDIAHHAEKVRKTLREVLDHAEKPDHIILCGDLPLAEEMIKGIDLPVTPINRKIDAKIDQKNPQKILKEILAYHRYRL